MRVVRLVCWVSVCWFSVDCVLCVGSYSWGIIWFYCGVFFRVVFLFGSRVVIGFWWVDCCICPCRGVHVIVVWGLCYVGLIVFGGCFYWYRARGFLEFIGGDLVNCDWGGLVGVVC